MPAHFSHLTSRPGVQSVMILSRKDGSIIQVSGVLAQNDATPTAEESDTSTPSEANVFPDDEKSAPETTPEETRNDDSNRSSNSNDNEESANTAVTADTPTQPYQPTHAELLAAHIFSFVASAVSLSDCLTDPKKGQKTPTENAPANETDTVADSESHDTPTSHGIPEREEEDDVKLLRMRTRLQEIIIIPDRRYLLCVVHDNSSTPSSQRK